MSATRFVMAAVMTAALAAPAAAQDALSGAAGAVAAAAASAKPVTRQLVPIELQVVIAKYQGEKRTSSIPYTMAINAVAGASLGSIERTQLTIGSEVPVPTTTFAPVGENKAAQPLRSFNYRNVGTVISAAAVTADAGQYEVVLEIDESSVGTNAFDGRGGAPTEMPVFRSFKARNRILLRPGQMRQFTAATDRVSGETVRIEVMLTVVK